MYRIHKSLVVSEIAVRNMDVYGGIVLINKRLSQEFIRKALINSTINTEIIHDCEGEHIMYKLGYLIHSNNNEPAIIHNLKCGDNIREWYKHGIIHRDNDQPAHVSKFYEKWYANGRLHRDSGLPAEINNCGMHNPCQQTWYKNGLLHRDNDLPAMIYHNGYQQYWKDGVQYKL